MSIVRHLKKLLLLNDGAVQACGNREDVVGKLVPKLGVVRAGAA